MWISMLLKVLCGGILLLETGIDIKQKKVHVSGAVIIAVCGMILLYSEQSFAIYSFIASISMGVFLLVFSILTEEKIGRGDAIYIMALGILLGLQRTMLVSMLSFMAAAFVGMILLIRKRATKQSKLPFFPFLFFGYMLVVCSEFHTVIQSVT